MPDTSTVVQAARLIKGEIESRKLSELERKALADLISTVYVNVGQRLGNINLSYGSCG